jgi:hypothetical protein
MPDPLGSFHGAVLWALFWLAVVYAVALVPGYLWG